MPFEWDSEKSGRHLRERDLSFADASDVFQDREAIVVQDMPFDYGESRFKIIGRIADRRVVAVIYANREGRTRIISARKANRNERQAYDQRSTKA